MTIAVNRKLFTPLSTEGELSIDGIHECYTLEPRKDQSQGKPFCIPAGLYRYFVGPSAHFGFDVIHLVNVPGFDDIEIHPGNFPQDTHGCTCVGTIQAANFVGHSKEAFAALMAKIPPQGEINYVDPIVRAA